MTSSAVWKHKLVPASQLWSVTVQVIPRPDNSRYMAAVFEDFLGASEADPVAMVDLLERWGRDNGYMASPPSEADDLRINWRVTLQRR